MEKELISVIVPIYNVEKYVEKCINSIVNQSYNNLEIILIDDGSTDNCGKICDRYKKIDDRIVVIHKKNGGLSSARNVGLDNANGYLIGFVDGDDYIELDMYEKLKKNMDYYGSDIVSCNVFYEKNNKKKTNKNILKKRLLYAKGKEKYEFIQNYAWNKLYKKNIFENIRYPINQICEDGFIICDLLDKAKSISFVDEPLYNYVYRKDSIIHKFSIKHFDSIISMNKKIEFFGKKRYFDLVTDEKNKKIDKIILNLANMERHKINNKEVYNKYYKELLDTNKDVKWEDANNKVKLFKVFRRSFISALAVMYRVKDFVRR